MEIVGRQLCLFFNIMVIPFTSFFTITLFKPVDTYFARGFSLHPHEDANLLNHLLHGAG